MIPSAHQRPDEFKHSLAIQRRVVGALLMREVITRFGRHNAGVLWLLGEPMLFTLGVTALWVAAGLNHGSDLPIVTFAITGYSAVLLWRNTVTRCCSALQQNVGLLYHRNVKAIDVFLSRIILEFTGATASFVVLTIFFVAIEAIPLPADLLVALSGWLLLAWFSAALALSLGALTAWNRLVERLWHPLSYLIFPLSGAAFMVDWLPPFSRDAVLLLPIVHGVEQVRHGFFGNAVPTHYDAGYLAGSALVLTLVGMMLTRRAAQRMEVD